MGHWFVVKQEIVTGPLSSSEVQGRFANGTFDSECLIWGQDRTQWESFPQWNASASTINSLSDEAKNSKVSQQWHFAVDGNSKGPMNREELINELKTLRHKDEVLLWTKGMKSWADLFEFDDLVEEIGMSRRAHPRVTIAGSLVVKDGENTFLGTLKSLSQGGFGAQQMTTSLAIGQIANVELRIEGIVDPIVTRAMVQYVSDQGVTGFRFDTINMEAKARVMDIIKARNKLSPAAA
jgi:hypothetical protein